MKTIKFSIVSMIGIMNLAALYYTILLFCQIPSFVTKATTILFIISGIAILPILIIGIIIGRIKFKKFAPYFNDKEYKILSCISFAIMLICFVGHLVAENFGFDTSNAKEFVFLIPLYPYLLVTLSSMLGDKNPYRFDSFP